jgi:adenine-specific DNA-methyltransferase
MASLASIGLMLWDGKSSGTLANIVRLIDKQKPVVVYHSKLHEFTNLKTRSDLSLFLSHCGTEAQRTFENIGELSERVLF